MRADAQKNYDHLLKIAGQVFTQQGPVASLRDVARRAGVGLATLYRHFPTREALLEALLREGLNGLTARADELKSAKASDEALVLWMRETIAYTHSHRGVIAPMVAAIDDPESALHASCVSLKSAGAKLLAHAQADGKARPDMNGTDLFALIAALAWLREQPSHAARADHLFGMIAGAILVNQGRAGSSSSKARKKR